MDAQAPLWLYNTKKHIKNSSTKIPDLTPTLNYIKMERVLKKKQLKEAEEEKEETAAIQPTSRHLYYVLLAKM